MGLKRGCMIGPTACDITRDTSLTQRLPEHRIVHVHSKIVVNVVLVLTLITVRQALCADGGEPSSRNSRNGLVESARALRDNPQLQERLREQQLQELKDIYGDFVKE